jgi:hypothetical protein
VLQGCKPKQASPSNTKYDAVQTVRDALARKRSTASAPLLRPSKLWSDPEEYKKACPDLYALLYKASVWA